jgi:hypothetical protein
MLIGCVAALASQLDAKSFVDTVLPWLPADSEAILFSSASFALDENPRGILSEYGALSALAYPAYDKGSALALDVKGLTVQAAVYAGRRFRVIEGKRGLGLVAEMDGCSIISFVDSKRIDRAISSIPSQLVSGEKIAVIRHSGTPEGDPPSTSYLATLAPGMVIACSERGFLSEILARRRSKAARAAFPEALPEWRWIDRTAKVWGLRRFSNVLPDLTSPRDPNSEVAHDANASGVAFELLSESQARVRFLSGDPRPLGLYADYWKLDGVKQSSGGEGVASVEYDPRKDVAGNIMFRVETVLLGRVVAL